MIYKVCILFDTDVQIEQTLELYHLTTLQEAFSKRYLDLDTVVSLPDVEGGGFMVDTNNVRSITWEVEEDK